MTLSAQLDALRADLPGCCLVAYGDAKAQLVLRSSSDSAWPQEKLDDMCKTGSRQFHLADAMAPFRKGPHAHREAIVATRRDIRVYVGAEAPASDMLCCVCRSGADTAQVLSLARLTLLQVMDGPNV